MSPLQFVVSIDTVVVMLLRSQNVRRRNLSINPLTLSDGPQVYQAIPLLSDNPTLRIETPEHHHEVWRRREDLTSPNNRAGFDVPTQSNQGLEDASYFPERITTLLGQLPKSGDTIALSTTNVQQKYYSRNCSDSSNSFERESHVSFECLQIPPEPIDLSALHEIWEQVRACKRDMASVSTLTRPRSYGCYLTD